MPVFEPILRISLFFSNFSNFIGNIYPVRYAVLIKRIAFVISRGEPSRIAVSYKAGDFVMYIEKIQGIG